MLFRSGNLGATADLTSTVLIGAGSTERLKVDSTGLYVNTKSVFVPRAASSSVSSGGTLTINSDNVDHQVLSTSGGTVTIAIPTGSPSNGQKLMVRIKDNGSATTLSWTTTAGGWRIIGSTLPTTTTANKTIYVGSIYNSADSYWDVVAVATEA